MVPIRWSSFALFLAAAWSLAAFQLVMADWASTALTMPDADDAMRLVELRDFLAGQPWFGLHEARLAPPVGYDSHWSRLIDLGLAGMLLTLQQFFAADFAERLTIAVWPVLWLLPCMAAVGAVGWRLAGQTGAAIALLLAVLSVPAFQNFRLGRIDHHNVQLALALLAIAAAVWSDKWRGSPFAVAVLSALALAIGLENLPFIVLAGAVFAVRFVINPETAIDLQRYGLTLAASVAIAFLVEVPLEHWTRTLCDAIAVNLASAVVVGGLLVAAAATWGQAPDWRWRALAVGAAALGALLTFTLQEPRCLHGPYATIDPAIKPIWLDHVSEIQSLRQVMVRSLTSGVATLAFPLVALISMIWLCVYQRRGEVFIAASALLLATLMMFAVVKVFSYAVWLGLPLIAAAVASIHRIVPRVFAAIALSPAAISIVAISGASATGSHPIVANTQQRQACVSRQGISSLNELPTGLILTNELEWAPYILAFTPHSVFAAPYHRLSSIIVTAHEALALPPEQARTVLLDNRIDYIAVCGAQGPLGMSAAQLKTGLWVFLQAGDVPSWLERVLLDGPYTVYRMRRTVDRSSSAQTSK